MLTASLYWVESPDYLSYNIFSKLVYAEVSKTTSASKRVFHQTVHAQNSILTKEIHDQGKFNKFSVLTYLNKTYIMDHYLWFISSI